MVRNHHRPEVLKPDRARKEISGIEGLGRNCYVAIRLPARTLPAAITGNIIALLCAAAGLGRNRLRWVRSKFLARGFDAWSPILFKRVARTINHH